MDQQYIIFENIRRSLWSSDNAYIRFLEQNRNRLFYSYPYPGNPGDDLIRLASEMLLDDLGIERTTDITRADFCLFAGGCPTMWPDVMKLIEAYLNSSNPGRLVIGPATFEIGLTSWPELFKQRKDRVAGLFARDWKSCQNLDAADLPDTIVKGLSHDPVFYLLGTSWHKQQRQNLSEEYILVSLRRDHEMNCELEGKMLKPFLPRLSHRMAKKLTRWVRKRNKKRKMSIVSRRENDRNLPVQDVDICSLDTEAYLETIRHAARIYTDRLHVMIVGSMLGKKISAFATAYGKLEHVYQTSMSGWADVKFGK